MLKNAYFGEKNCKNLFKTVKKVKDPPSNPRLLPAAGGSAPRPRVVLLPAITTFPVRF